MKEKLKVIVKEPFKPFEIREIEAGLESYYRIIGCSCIGCSNITRNVHMIFDDEYLLNGSKPNLKFRDPKIDHIICGTVIFAGITPWGETVSLDDPELTKMMLEVLFHQFTPEQSQNEDPAEYTGVTIITFGPIEED